MGREGRGKGRRMGMGRDWSPGGRRAWQSRMSSEEAAGLTSPGRGRELQVEAVMAGLGPRRVRAGRL